MVSVLDIIFGQTDHKNATNDSYPTGGADYLSAMLKDIRVLELASVLAGPSAGQFFAELGAEVIKIENPATGGDVTRSWKSAGERTDDRSAYFSCCNWGKKSVLLDLHLSDDRDKLYRLAATADIVIASYKPGDAQKLGVDFETLSVINPKLIYGQITGYSGGDDRVGYDAVIQAESGFMDLNGPADGEPLKMPVALVDVLAAHHLKEGLLLALLDRVKSGKGSLVSVSLFDAAVASLANQATNWLVGGTLPLRKGSVHPNIAPYGETFLTADGKRILLAVGTDRQFSDLCAVLGLQELPDQESYSRNSSRVANRQVLGKLLGERINHMNSADLIRSIREKKIPAGLVRNLREVFSEAEGADYLLQAGDYSGVRNFVASFGSGNLAQPLSAPPHLGQHTQEVLGNLP